MFLKIIKSLLVINNFRIFLLLIVSVGFNANSFAQGDLLVLTKRVVFDSKKGTKKILLSNIGEDTTRYNISFVEYKMEDNGKITSIKDPEYKQQFASPYLRIFPRNIVLGPRETQTIKVQLFNTNDLEDGEYRSHLYFRPIKKINNLIEQNKNEKKDFSVKIDAVFGVAIACIIRNGVDNTTVSIADFQLENENETYNLLFKLNRQGNMSSYGDFTINYTSQEGKSFEVANAKGVGVYTPNLYRIMNIKLTKPENVTFSGGSFQVIYFQNESKKVLAEGTFKL